MEGEAGRGIERFPSPEQTKRGLHRSSVTRLCVDSRKGWRPVWELSFLFSLFTCLLPSLVFVDYISWRPCIAGSACIFLSHRETITNNIIYYIYIYINRVLDDS